MLITYSYIRRAVKSIVYSYLFYALASKRPRAERIVTVSKRTIAPTTKKLEILKT
jgi:hypothetical protein